MSYPQAAPSLLSTSDGSPVLLADFYRGRPAFLLAGGPSVRELDLSPLRQAGCLTLGINNALKTFRTDLWVSVDDPAHFMRSIWLDPKVLKFVPICHADQRIFDSDRWKYLDITVAECPAVLFCRRNDRFDSETFLTEPTINWGNHARWGGGRSVMLPALRLLFYLGVRDVFLLGVDFHMDASHTYHFPQKRGESSLEGNRNTYKAMQQRLAALKESFEAHDFHIMNCNPDSKLRIFPFVSFDEAIRYCRTGFPADESLERTEGLYDEVKDDPIPPTRESIELQSPEDGPSRAVVYPLPEDLPKPSLELLEQTRVVVAADHHSQWLLPWWHEHFKRHNDIPVIFFDLGMSSVAREWCEKQGSVLDLPTDVPRNFSKAWFYKPYCLLVPDSPVIIYMDLDCEVRGSILPLIQTESPPFALARDRHPCGNTRERFDPNHYFNSGVIFARSDNTLASLWAQYTESLHTEFRGDQEILNYLLQSYPCEIGVIPQRFNRLRLDGDSSDAQIMHWTGSLGKNQIRSMMTGLAQLPDFAWESSA